jgi:hypothetical protein
VVIRLPQSECGSPVSTVVLGDGKRRHTMAEGEMLEEYAPRFRLEYQSAFPSKTCTHVDYLAGATSSKSTQDWPRSSRTARPKITIHPAFAAAGLIRFKSSVAYSDCVKPIWPRPHRAPGAAEGPRSPTLPGLLAVPGNGSAAPSTADEALLTAAELQTEHLCSPLGLRTR